MWTCDVCDQPFTDDRPMYDHRTTRPSDPHDMCCVMVTHNDCMAGGKTPAEWDAWMETQEARDMKIWFLT